jgi:hypothetical protein
MQTETVAHITQQLFVSSPKESLEVDRELFSTLLQESSTSLDSEEKSKDSFMDKLSSLLEDEDLEASQAALLLGYIHLNELEVPKEILGQLESIVGDKIDVSLIADSFKTELFEEMHSIIENTQPKESSVPSDSIVVDEIPGFSKPTEAVALEQVSGKQNEFLQSNNITELSFEDISTLLSEKLTSDVTEIDSISLQGEGTVVDFRLHSLLTEPDKQEETFIPVKDATDLIHSIEEVLQHEDVPEIQRFSLDGQKLTAQFNQLDGEVTIQVENLEGMKENQMTLTDALILTDIEFGSGQLIEKLNEYLSQNSTVVKIESKEEPVVILLQEPSFLQKTGQATLSSTQEIHTLASSEVLEYVSEWIEISSEEFTQEVGQTKTTIQLTPEHLGRIEIQLEKVDNELFAKMMVSTRETKEWLDVEIAELFKNSDSATFKSLTRMSVEVMPVTEENNADLSFMTDANKQDGQEKGTFEKQSFSKKLLKNDYQSSEQVVEHKGIDATNGRVSLLV